jgi:hypothetical protein
MKAPISIRDCSLPEAYIILFSLTVSGQTKCLFRFLFPGYVQLIFGAGLRTGRYLAVIEELLAMVAVWIAARRTGGKWLATAIIWSMALSPAAIKATTMGVTQPLIACLFAWTLLLTTGEKRPLWQLILGTAIASTMILTRQNMAPVLPLLLLYIFLGIWLENWISMCTGRHRDSGMGSRNLLAANLANLGRLATLETRFLGRVLDTR